MKRNVGEIGITFLEVLLSITVISIICASLLPILAHVRQYELSWDDKIKLQQEAIRFFTYLENRNACFYDAIIANRQLTLYVCQSGKDVPKIRTLYFSDNKIYEEDHSTKGYLELVRHVQSVSYVKRDYGIEITLTLGLGTESYTYQWLLVRNLHRSD